MTTSPILIIVTAVILIIGAVIAIPIMNRRKYGKDKSGTRPR